MLRTARTSLAANPGVSTTWPNRSATSPMAALLQTPVSNGSADQPRAALGGGGAPIAALTVARQVDGTDREVAVHAGRLREANPQAAVDLGSRHLPGELVEIERVVRQ